MNIRQSNTLESFSGVAEVIRMMLECPDWYPAASDEGAKNECRQTTADFEYRTARLRRKARDFLEITADRAITVLAPGALELRQNFGLRRSILGGRSKPFDSDAELTFPVDTLDFFLN